MSYLPYRNGTFFDRQKDGKRDEKTISGFGETKYI